MKAKFRSLLSRLSSPVPGMALAIIVTFVVGVAPVAVALWEVRSSEREQSALRTEHEARLLAQRMDDVLLRVDGVLASATFDWEERGWSAAEAVRLTFLARQLPPDGCMSAIGSAGEPIAESCAPTDTAPMTAEVFARHAEGREILVLATDPARERVAISRSAIDRDGRFLGVVRAEVDAGELLDYDSDRHRFLKQSVYALTGELIVTSAASRSPTNAGEAIVAAIRDNPLASVVVQRRGDILVAAVLAGSRPLVAVVSTDTSQSAREWARTAILVGLLVSITLLTILWLVHRVITTRNALADERRRLANIIWATNVGTWEWNVQTGEIRVNERWAEIIGRSLTELTPTDIDTWISNTHPDDLERSERMLERHFGGELETYECEARMRHRDGGWVWIFDCGRLLSRTEDGKPLWMAGTHLDITRRKQVESELAEARATLEAALANSPSAILIADAPDGRIRFANAAARSILGNHGTPDGEDALRLFHPDGTRQPPDGHPLTRAIVNGEVIRDEEAQVENPLRGRRWVSVSAAPVRDQNGEIRSGIVVLHDITERRHAQASLQEQVEKFQAQAGELARSNEELEAFAYATSHDLRQPLRTVISYLTLLEGNLKDTLDADGREFLDFARDGAKRMDQLILDILAYSRVGRMTHPFEPCALRDIVDIVIANLEAAIREAGAAISIVSELPEVAGDWGELTRLLQNLIGNAVKYRSPDRAPLITLAAATENGFWHLTVSDNGIGIAAEHRERIFGIFQRLHRREEYEGTGIGLALCRKIAEHHGGRIWVESELGAGSVFHVTLPHVESIR